MWERSGEVGDVATLAAVCAGAATLLAGAGPAGPLQGAAPNGLAASGAAPAVLLLAGSDGDADRDGVRRLAAWLLAGVAVGGVVGYLLIAVLGAPLSLQVGVGLGVALGGGLGAVANLLATDPERTAEEETVDVDMAERESKTPRPADLFEDHPDPVLYVADEGHGPVVRAANDAYADAFDVPASGVEGAPLSDAVMSAAGTDDVVDAIADDRSLDVVVDCETPDGDRQFRLRVAGDRRDCYLMYTPVEW